MGKILKMSQIKIKDVVEKVQLSGLATTDKTIIGSIGGLNTKLKWEKIGHYITKQNVNSSDPPLLILYKHEIFNAGDEKIATGLRANMASDTQINIWVNTVIKGDVIARAYYR